MSSSLLLLIHVDILEVGYSLLKIADQSNVGHQAYSLATWKSNLDFPTVDHEQEQTNSQSLNLP